MMNLFWYIRAIQGNLLKNLCIDLEMQEATPKWLKNIYATGLEGKRLVKR